MRFFTRQRIYSLLPSKPRAANSDDYETRKLEIPQVCAWERSQKWTTNRKLWDTKSCPWVNKKKEKLHTAAQGFEQEWPKWPKQKGKSKSLLYRRYEVQIHIILQMSEIHHLRIDQNSPWAVNPRVHQRQMLPKRVSHNPSTGHSQTVTRCKPHKETSKTWKQDKWEISLLKNNS